MNHDEELILDYGAAKGDVASFIEKIDTHLQVERKLLEAWQHKDNLDEQKEQGDKTQGRTKQ